LKYFNIGRFSFAAVKNLFIVVTALLCIGAKAQHNFDNNFFKQRLAALIDASNTNYSKIRQHILPASRPGVYTLFFNSLKFNEADSSNILMDAQNKMFANYFFSYKNSNDAKNSRNRLSNLIQSALNRRLNEHVNAAATAAGHEQVFYTLPAKDTAYTEAVFALDIFQVKNKFVVALNMSAYLNRVTDWFELAPETNAGDKLSRLYALMMNDFASPNNKIIKQDRYTSKYNTGISLHGATAYLTDDEFERKIEFNFSTLSFITEDSATAFYNNLKESVKQILTGKMTYAATRPNDDFSEFAIYHVPAKKLSASPYYVVIGYPQGNNKNISLAFKRDKTNPL